MKITIINHSDTAGGSSIVSMRLLKALCALGHDARMVVADKQGNSLRVATAASPWRTRAAFLAEAGFTYLHNGRCRDTLFKISPARFGLPLAKHPWVEDAEVIILGWVNQGLLSLDDIRALHRTDRSRQTPEHSKQQSDRPVLWIMHDAWCATGVCHYTAGCTHYLNGCGNCPLLGSAAGRKDLSAATFARKARLYASMPIHFVAVSNGLADLCRTSPLLADARLSVVPNPFPAEEYSPLPTKSREGLGLPREGRLIIMAAARLDDPVKNLPLAIDALNQLTDTASTSSPLTGTASHSESAPHTDITAVFIGDLRNPDALSGLRLPYRHLGKVEAAKIPAIMAHASVVLSTSVWETLPTTLIEGLAAGAAVVATSTGGQADIITDPSLGRLVPADATRIATAIREALALPADAAARRARHASVASRFDARSIARRLLALCTPH